MMGLWSYVAMVLHENAEDVASERVQRARECSEGGCGSNGRGSVQQGGAEGCGEGRRGCSERVQPAGAARD